MIKAEHVLAAHHLLRESVLVVEVVGFGVGGTLNDGELYLFELLPFDACPLRDSFLGIFENFALSMELATAIEVMDVTKKKKKKKKKKKNVPG